MHLSQLSELLDASTCDEKESTVKNNVSTRQNKEMADWRKSVSYRALCGCPINAG